MTTTRSVAFLVALAVVGLTVAPLASGAVVSPFTAADTGQSETATTNASVGTLMQASAADTKSAVETGMFEAAYETADNESRAAVVSDRTAALEAQLDALQTERAELQNQSEKLSQGTYRSRMAKLTVEIASLERSIDRTERRAAEVGVDEDRLAELRGAAAAMRENATAEAGPGVAALVRGLSKGGGPPAGAGPPENGGPSSETPGNGQNGNSGDSNRGSGDSGDSNRGSGDSGNGNPGSGDSGNGQNGN
ncbi:hypothetical protein [Natrinema sp. 1APR25-10V2]|uniref:pentapeptide repeat-containing protein n=1 Tax=Natrinema sp. 1APR25-10V2 TaxID=2951081 RepID=UPI002876D398|nr:hypothetical protein [Natrinema sp. 1APR25-10V2]MDS0473915.1 hypothetical protein [Natrinema sp. 1APR25-10V2]